MEHETLSNKKHLFVDMADVELRENVRQVFHQAEKIGPHPVLWQ